MLTDKSYLFPGVSRLFVNPAPAVAHSMQGDLEAGVVTANSDILASFDQMVSVARPKRVVVVGETASPLVQQNVKVLREAYPSESNGIAVDYLLDLPMDKLLRQVEKLPPDTAIFYVLILRDGAGQNFIPYIAAQQITQRASAPVFSHWDSLLGSGIAGGYMLSANRVGEIAARDILTMLAGGMPAAPSAKASQAFGHIYDWRALDRFDITLSQLPANSEVLHRQPSLLMVYRSYIIGTAVLALLFGMLAIGWISILRRRRDHLEELVNDRTAEVKEKALQLGDALAREKEYSALQKKFVSLVSHEFRTPLSIIDGAAQRLIRSKDKLNPDEVETRANKVRSAVTRMVGLIDTTLYASRLDSGRIEMRCESSDIGKLLLDVCERQTEISPSHQIRATIDDLPGEVFADLRLLDQVFTNLLSNAVKYAPDAPLIEVTGKVDGDMALVSIKDQGLGIPENDLPHMFQRFFRAKTAEGIKGTGIGLSVVKEFVEMHDGTIEVASTEGEGSTFTVRLPINGNGQ